MEVKKKKNSHRSYADAVKSSIPDLSKPVNSSIPVNNFFIRLSNDLRSRSVFSRLSFPNQACDLPNLANSNSNFRQSCAAFTDPHSRVNHGINIDLNLGSSNPNLDILTGTNQVPLGPRSKPKSSFNPPDLGRRNYSRCLSYSHLRPNCTYSVCCNSCFRLGHVAGSCRFPPWFPGLSMEHHSSFPFYSNNGLNSPVTHWFYSGL